MLLEAYFAVRAFTTSASLFAEGSSQYIFGSPLKSCNIGLKVWLETLVN